MASARAARKYAIRAAAGALLGTSATGEIRRGVLGGGAALAAVSLTVAAGIGLLSGHRAAADPPAIRPSASALASASLPPVSASPHPDPSAPPAAWQQSNVLIVDGSTGSRYVYLEGVLRPVRNTASAMLVLGGARPKTVTLGHAVIAAAETGPPIGIAAAPDALPAPSAILRGGWVICSGPVSAADRPAERLVASMSGTFTTGGFAGYGSSLTGGTGLGNAALVVRAAGVDYLIRQHHSYRLTDPDGVFAAWKWTGVTPLPVTADVLSALPVGTGISPRALGAKPTHVSVAPSSTLCMTLGADGHATHTVIGAKPATGVGAARLVMPAHAGVLVRASTAASTIYLVTDAGIRYQIANGAALASLGYASVPTVSVPADVLARIPSGPKLSRFVAING